MGRGVPIVWSAREKPIVDAAVRALIAGEYSTITGAARSCLEQLTALRRDAPDAQSSQAPKTLSGVYDYLRVRTRGKRLHGPETYWTEAEDRVLRRHVGALLRGRYRSVGATTEASIREFERLRGSGGGWSPSPRTQRAVYTRVVDLARKAGRRQWRVPYAKAELDTFDRYARAVADGRYRDLSLAVTLCLKDLARLRRRQAGLPARPFRTIHAQISVRAHKLGWRWSAERWRPDEQRIVDRYVRTITEGGQPSLYQATRDCLADLEALHLRLDARDSALRSSYRRRTFATLRTYLDRWSRSMGRRITQAWT